jgi:hypothetical protein
MEGREEEEEDAPEEEEEEEGDSEGEEEGVEEQSGGDSDEEEDEDIVAKGEVGMVSEDDWVVELFRVGVSRVLVPPPPSLRCDRPPTLLIAAPIPFLAVSFPPIFPFLSP